MHKRQVPLIIYMNSTYCNEKMWTFIQAQCWYGQVEIYYNLVSFFHRFTSWGCNNTVTVLLVANRRELEAIMRHADLLVDQKIIMVLPDRAKETLSMGHALYPRFIGYLDDDLQEVASVLHKLVNSGKSALHKET